MIFIISCIEIWKDIEGYEGYYQISNLGNVKNIITNTILTGDINSAGYRRVCLYMPVKKRFFIHRLVAYHFCSGYCPGLVVDHINGNKLDNRACNLEWVTRSENDLRAFKLGLRSVYRPPYKKRHLIQTFDIETNEIIHTYDDRQDFCDNNNYSMHSIGELLSTGYYYSEKSNRNSKKIGIKSMHPENPITYC